MATKYLTESVIIRSFNNDTLDSEVGLEREPVIDRRYGKVKLRLFDGVTPGGNPWGTGLMQLISRPTITAPLDGANGIGLSPIITASAFLSQDIQNYPHISTRWQVATDALFTSIVYDSNDDTTNKTTIDLSGKATLTANTLHYVRVQYVSAGNERSQWSPVTTFQTGV